MNYIGLDSHKKYSFVTIITEDGEVKEKKKFISSKESFKEYLNIFKRLYTGNTGFEPATSGSGGRRSS